MPLFTLSGDFWKASHTIDQIVSCGVKYIEEGKCFLIIAKQGCIKSCPLPDYPHRFPPRVVSSVRRSSAGDSSMEAMQDAKQTNGLSLVGSRGARKTPSFVVSGHPVQHTAHNWYNCLRCERPTLLIKIEMKKSDRCEECERWLNTRDTISKERKIQQLQQFRLFWKEMIV